MKLRVGGTYRMRGGGTVTIVKHASHDDMGYPSGYPFLSEDGRSWMEDGHFRGTGRLRPMDLVEEAEPDNAVAAAPDPVEVLRNAVVKAAVNWRRAVATDATWKAMTGAIDALIAHTSKRDLKLLPGDVCRSRGGALVHLRGYPGMCELRATRIDDIDDAWNVERDGTSCRVLDIRTDIVEVVSRAAAEA